MPSSRWDWCPSFITRVSRSSSRISPWPAPKAGPSVLEFTHRGDRAYQLFVELAEFCQKNLPDLILGEGTIHDAPTAAMYIGAGPANFIVGPMLNPEVARLSNRRQNRLYPRLRHFFRDLPGRRTGRGDPDNLSWRHLGRTGIRQGPLWPVPLVQRHAHRRRGRYPRVPRVWFKSGVTCVGMGSNLIKSNLVASGDFQALTVTVQKVINWIAEIRQKMKRK